MLEKCLCEDVFDEHQCEEKCEMCGEYENVRYVFSGVCASCLFSYSKDVDTCERIGEGIKKEIEINGLYASVFGVREIEHVLRKELKRRIKDCYNGDCLRFISENRNYFAMEVKKNESE